MEKDLTKEESRPVSQEKPKKKKSSYKKRILLIAVILLVAVGIFLRNQVIVASVNGKPISRLAVIRELEKMYGDEALQALVTRELIEQKIAEEDIEVSEQEITEELNTIKEGIVAQGGDFNTLLLEQGVTEAEVRDQLRMQKSIEKMIGDTVTVSDAEVTQAVEENQLMFGGEEDEEITDEMRAGITEQLRQQKLSQEIQSWIGILQNEASVVIYRNY